MIIMMKVFFDIGEHTALDRNPGPGYDTLLVRLIPIYLYSACPQRHINTLPSLSHIQASLPTSTLMLM